MLSRGALRSLMGQATSAGSLEAVYDAALRCVHEGLDVERASLLLFDAAGKMRFVAWSGLSDAYRAEVDGHSPWRRDETAATPVLVSDVEMDATFAPFQPAFKREGIRALAFVPLQFGTALLGKFMLYYREPHAFSNDEVAAAQQIADYVAFALEHHRIAVALDAPLAKERESRQHAEAEAVERRASESRLRLALASGRMGAWNWDIPSGRIDWSPELESMFGLGPGGFAGTYEAYRTYLHPEDRERCAQVVAAVLEAPETQYDLEYRIVRPDGACRWISTTGRVLVDAAGKPALMVGICRDITEAKHADQKKAMLARQLEVLANISNQIAGVFDPNEAIEQLAARVVPTFADYCVTYIADEGTIKPLGFAHCDPTKYALVAALADATRVTIDDEYGPGMVIRRGEACLRSEFSIAWAEAVAPHAPQNEARRALGPRSMLIVPLNARGRTLGALVLAATDESGRRFGEDDKQIAMELASRAALLVDNARLYAEARSAIRARDDMMALVSHDLRDPLQSIAAAAATLSFEPQGRGKGESIRSITLASAQMRLLVQDLLDISRIDAGQFAIRKRQVDVAALLEEARAVFQPQVEAKAVRLECTLDDELPSAMADRHRVLQVLQNLIGNALKFVTTGDVITLGAEHLDHVIRIYVADTGMGIAEEHVAKVFDRFWRADGREGGGVGLGLAVAKSIVEAHGGTIGVNSRRGVGTTFFFTLPVHAAAEPPDLVREIEDHTARAVQPLTPKYTHTADREYRWSDVDPTWPPEHTVLRQVLDGLPLAACACDGKGHLTYFNKAAVELWGREPKLDDPAQRFCGSWRLLTPAGAPISHDQSWIARALDTRTPCNGDGAIVERPDGTRRHVLAHAAPILEDDGRLLAAVNVLWDITEFKQAQAAVREADRKHDEFLATLAHELRNPLAPLRAGVAVIRMASADPDTVIEHCTLMERQLHQLARVVDDLVDVSDATHRRLQLETSRIDLAAAVRTAVEQCRAAVAEADHDFSVTLPEGRTLVDADPHRLCQVLAQVLSNAIKYTPAGGRIHLSVTHVGSSARISIRDNGLGIPREKLATIFEMAGELDRSLETGYKGLGIGLTLAKAIVDLHGGTIEAQSDGVGRGSVFSVTLPMVAQLQSAVSLSEERASAESAGNCRVLLVDDNRDLTRAVVRLIRLLGHDIRVAFDGQEALEIASEYRPDVVLLDIGLPKLNGYDVARQMRSHPWSEKMTLVAMTGWGRDTDRNRSRDAGFDRHLTKPVDPNVLEALLNSCSAHARH